MKQSKLLTAFVAVVLLGVAASASAQTTLENADATAADADATAAEVNAYYRWIDQHGRIQYTDFEPVGIPFERIELQPADAAPGTSMLISAEEDPADPFLDQAEQILPIEHIGPCANARQQLTVLHSKLPVYEASGGLFRTAWRGDSYRGERRYLEAEERQAAIVSAQSAVLKHCSDPAAFDAEVDAFKAQLKR